MRLNRAIIPYKSMTIKPLSAYRSLVPCSILMKYESKQRRIEQRSERFHPHTLNSAMAYSHFPSQNERVQRPKYKQSKLGRTRNYNVNTDATTIFVCRTLALFLYKNNAKFTCEIRYARKLVRIW